MIRKFIYISVFFINSTFSFAQPVKEWSQRYSFAGSSDIGSSVSCDGDNNVVVIGTSGPSTNTDIVTIKYSTSGEQLWTRRYDADGKSEIAEKVLLDSKGNILVLGSSETSQTANDFVIVKYRFDGNFLWDKRFSSAGDFDDFTSAMVLDSSDFIYVTGKFPQHFCTIKCDSAGNQIWIRQLKAALFNDYPYSICVDDSLNVFVAGELNQDCCLIKYNSLGDQEWVSIYDGKLHSHDFALSMDIDQQFNILVAGSSIEFPDTYGGYIILKFNTMGEKQWSRTYEGSANFIDVARVIKSDSVGNIYVTGYSTEQGMGYNFTTIKYNSQGEAQWVSSYNNGLNDIAYDLVIDHQGNAYVTGSSDGNGTNVDYSTVKYSKNGKQFWNIRYDSSGQFGDFAYAISLDRFENIIVTGSSNRDILTIKYSQFTGIEANNFYRNMSFMLGQNYPNPFNPNTRIKFSISQTCEVELKIYNVFGSEVQTLINGKKNPGNYVLEFDGTNLPSGIYFYSLKADGNITDTRKMILLK